MVEYCSLLYRWGSLQYIIMATTLFFLLKIQLNPVHFTTYIACSYEKGPFFRAVFSDVVDPDTGMAYGLLLHADSLF